MSNKILPLEELAKQVQRYKQEGKTVALCHGVFDLLHLGHIRYLRSARKFADVLIVTLTKDEFVNKGSGRPAFTSVLRAEALAALEVVDHVAINHWATAVETILLLQPHFYVKGPDYKDVQDDVTRGIIKEKNAIIACGGQMVFTDDDTFSSSKLLLNYSHLYTDQQREYANKISNQFSLKDIELFFNKMEDLNVLVIGEAILDQYCYSKPLGKAGKDSFMVTQFKHKEVYLGGVLAVARHLRNLNAQVEVFTYLGEKLEYKDKIEDEMPDVQFNFVAKKDSTTIVKRRYVDSYSKNKLFGVYDFNDEYLSPEQEASSLQFLEDNLERFDLVLVVDYGHGLITPEMINVICEKSTYLALNTQINSANIGFHTISKYPTADCVCIHSGELHQDYRSRFAKTEDLTVDLFEKMNAQRCIITLGQEGLLGYDGGEIERCPAFAVNIVDRVGAGDTVLSFTALASVLNMPLSLVLLVGNLVGAQSVSSVGTKIPLHRQNLMKSIKALL